jgi:predicted transcriptional regulator
MMLMMMPLKKTTKTMYGVLEKYPRLKEYWTLLTKEGLLSRDIVTQKFKTTEKGLRVIEAYNRINDLINAEQL